MPSPRAAKRPLVLRHSAVSAFSHLLRPPPELAAPAVAAAISAAFFGWAAYLAGLGLGGGVAALFPSVAGLAAGLTASIRLGQRWRLDRGNDRPRRAVWLGLSALLLVPFVAVLCIAGLGLAAALFVRP